MEDYITLLLFSHYSFQQGIRASVRTALFPESAAAEPEACLAARGPCSNFLEMTKCTLEAVHNIKPKQAEADLV